MKFWQLFSLRNRALSQEDHALAAALMGITGARPRNLDLYKLALRHSSTTNQPGEIGPANNERLEFLGDAILGAIVGEYLFKKYPLRDEGFLTEIRSRIVNRESMAVLAQKISLPKLITFNSRMKGGMGNKTMHGDAMEALIGAVYLDKGYEFCRKFIVDRLIAEHLDLNELVAKESNPKSRIIEWAQRRSKQISFETVSETGRDHQKMFVIQVLIGGKVMGEGRGGSKKKAEQDAAAAALTKVADKEKDKAAE